MAVGLKESGGRIVAPREPCLKVHLYLKGHPTSGDWIDEWGTVTTREYGRVAFRTDVVDCGGAWTNSGYFPSPFLEASEQGSACCLLTDGTDRFLLSAAHVLDGANPLLNVSWSRPGFRVGHGQFIGNPETYWRYEADSTSGDAGMIDAGLVRVQDAGLFDNPNAVPWGVAPFSWEELSSLDFVTLCGAYSRLVSATSVGFRPTGDHVSVGGRDFKYWRVWLFRFVDQQEITVGGDSGCPVIAPDGRLVGMHVGIFRSEGIVYSMTLCIGDLISMYRKLISSELVLVSYTRDDNDAQPTAGS